MRARWLIDDPPNKGIGDLVDGGSRESTPPFKQYFNVFDGKIGTEFVARKLSHLGPSDIVDANETSAPNVFTPALAYTWPKPGP